MRSRRAAARTCKLLPHAWRLAFWMNRWEDVLIMFVYNRVRYVAMGAARVISHAMDPWHDPCNCYRCVSYVRRLQLASSSHHRSCARGIIHSHQHPAACQHRSLQTPRDYWLYLSLWPEAQQEQLLVQQQLLRATSHRHAARQP